MPEKGQGLGKAHSAICCTMGGLSSGGAGASSLLWTLAAVASRGLRHAARHAIRPDHVPAPRRVDLPPPCGHLPSRFAPHKLKLDATRTVGSLN